MNEPRPVRERFWEKVVLTETCWLWVASHDAKGYGTFWDSKRTVGAHRWAYIDLVGEIPTGLVLDHLCRTPACVNPDHLEPVTFAENVRRGDHSISGQWNRERTHCPAGHPYDEENTHVRKTGWRQCRACGKEQARERRQRLARIDPTDETMPMPRLEPEGNEGRATMIRPGEGLAPT